MRQWLRSKLEAISSSTRSNELFCRLLHLPEVLSEFFNQVVAIEVDKKAVLKQSLNARVSAIALDLLKLGAKIYSLIPG